MRWNEVYQCESMTRPWWLKDTQTLGTRYQACFPRGPAYSVTSADRTTWKLVDRELDASYHAQD